MVFTEASRRQIAHIADNLPSAIMTIPAHLPFLLLAISTTAAPVLNVSNPGPASLTLQPLPNPFPVPDTGISLEFAFLPATPARLSKTDTTDCFAEARQHFETEISVEGDIPMTHRYEVVCGEVYLRMVTNGAPVPRMTYSEAVGALLGASLKMAREGYAVRHARVLRTEGGDLLGALTVKLW